MLSITRGQPVKIFVVYEDIKIGVFSEPYSSGPTWFYAGHFMLFEPATVQTGFKVPAYKNGFIDQDPFNLVSEEGVVYEACRLYSYTSCSRSNECIIFEGVYIQHEAQASARHARSIR